MEIETTTEPILLKTGCGGVMGDPFNVQGFAGAFRKPVEDWAEQVRERIPSTNLLQSSWAGGIVDMSYQKYADDLLRIVPLPIGDTMIDVIADLRTIDRILDHTLEPAGAAACKRFLREQGVKEGRLEGTVSDVARYLGPVITPLQQSSPEIERRIAASSAGFYSMGAFWSLNIPRKWKR
eukprot:7033314-Pyramimonas_sp.AAC.1